MTTDYDPDDYSCIRCHVSLHVPDEMDPLEPDVRFCPSCAIDEIERLRAIVDRLPRTADGVPVVPTRDQVYGGEKRTINRRAFFSCLHNWNTLPACENATAEEQAFPVPVSKCYSTHEAAERARKGVTG
jgi:hypothetical protein